MLAAPIIQGTLPAFYKEDNGTVKLTVPFSMSRAVHSSQIIGFNVKIKNLQGTTYLVSGFSNSVDYANSVVTFNLAPVSEKTRLVSEIDALYADADKDLAEAEVKYKEAIAAAQQMIEGENKQNALNEAERALTVALEDWASAKQDVQKDNPTYTTLKASLDEHELYGVWDPVPGTFYKVQIAYVDQSHVTGYYSTVGVVKCTTRPNISIYGLNPAATNGHLLSYVGKYDQINEEQDKTEKVFSYRFILENNNGEVVKDTGYLTHNNSNDTNGYESYDIFEYNYELPVGEKYYLTYWVKTTNNLEVASPVYTIMQRRSVPSDSQMTLHAALDSENACIKLSLQGAYDEYGDELPVRGSFVIMRSSDKSNYKQWERIVEFDLASDPPSSRTWEDFTIEQGVFYNYSLQQYNSNIYSERALIKEPVYADFEYSYLFDGKRQLKIKFNPKVSSFKKDLLESKADTIGSKYPFIFKNGRVEYKEFPISGLLSYWSDEQCKFMDFDNFEDNQYRKVGIKYNPVPFPENLLYSPAAQTLFKKSYLKDCNFYFIKTQENAFIKWKVYLLENYPTLVLEDWDSVKNVFLSNLNKIYFQVTVNENVFTDQQIAFVENRQAYEIARERAFKTEVFEWLTNGQPKMFKSPSEGNYLVRLMNVNLAPMDQTGRMLHTFNCTAYEIADMTYDSLVELGFINIEELKKTVLKVTTIPFYTTDDNYAKLNAPLYVQDGQGYFAVGNLLQRVGNVEKFILEDVPFNTTLIIDGVTVKIGGSGGMVGDIPTTSIILEDRLSKGQLTVYYYEIGVDTPFSHIKNVEVRDIFAKQVIGEHRSVENDLENIEKSVGHYYDIKFIKRHIEETTAISVKSGIYDLTGPDGSTVMHIAFPGTGDKTYKLSDVSTEDCEVPINPLYGYGFSIPKDPWMGHLFTPVVYLNVSNQDIGNETERNLALRTSSNTAIQNYPDDFERDIRNGVLYEYTTKNGKWDFYQLTATTDEEMEAHKSAFFFERLYAYKRDIDYVLVPEDSSGVYLTPECYDAAKKIYQLMEKKSGSTNLVSKFENIYRSFAPTASINGGDILMWGVDTLSTGELDEVHGLDIGPGVYCELYYQEQRAIYDVSLYADALHAQQRIDNYLFDLSRTQMENYCLTSNNSNNSNVYVKKLLDVYKNFYSQYEIYLGYLAIYLNSISQGVGLPSIVQKE